MRHFQKKIYIKIRARAKIAGPATSKNQERGSESSKMQKRWSSKFTCRKIGKKRSCRKKNGKTSVVNEISVHGSGAWRVSFIESENPESPRAELNASVGCAGV